MKGGVGTAEINNGTCARFVEDGCWWFHQYWGKNQMEILIDIEHPSLDTHTHTCSEISYRITVVECIGRAQNNPLKSDRRKLDDKAGKPV